MSPLERADQEAGKTWSLIVPTFNRPLRLRACIDAVRRLEAPTGGFELVVVDDGGDADLSFLEGHSDVLLVRQENSGPAAARNTGVRHSFGSRLAFLDDDCEPDPGWLVALDRAWEDLDSAAGPTESSLALLGGVTRNGLTGSALSAASQDIVDCLYQRANVQPVRGGFFASNNLVTSRALFDAIGGFDQRIGFAGGEDRLFCHAAAGLGALFAYVPDAFITHRHGLTLTSFLQQHVRYGRGVRLYRQLGGSPEYRVPPGLLGRVRETLHYIAQPFRSEVGELRLRRMMALVLSQFATAAGALAAPVSGEQELEWASEPPS